MSFPRSSGILLHPTSLPGRFGIGDLGDEAYRFVDFLAASGQRLWQILPLGPPGYGNSPYQCFSAFAGHTQLISPERLVEGGFLSRQDLEGAPDFPSDRVDFDRVAEFKRSLLDQAFDRFKRTNDDGLRADFANFCRQHASWLEDFALFSALREAHDGAEWITWELALARREPGALAAAHEKLAGQVAAQRFFQYLFFKQWAALKAYCRERGIKIFGDMPIFVAYNSADVWTHPELFKLDGAGRPTVVSGVPPDLFSATGQLWGNPLYNWEKMRATGYQWWLDRMRSTFELVDIVRIDHFRGFAACWEIPSGEETAERGQWVGVPGRELFATMRRVLGDGLPIIAEDLGIITEDVEALRDEFGFPGMRVLQFAFGGDSRNPHLPHNYVRNTVVYTGTHDNDTVPGWFQREPGAGSTLDAAAVERQRRHCLKYLNSDGKQIHWDFIRAAYGSVAQLAMVQLQDALGLGSDARMNLPASVEGNWGWRCHSALLTDELRHRLREMVETYQRTEPQ